MAGKVGKESRGQRWLAAKLGISQSRISRLLAAEDWAFPREGWTADDIARIKHHLAERRSSANATAGSVDEPVGSLDDAKRALQKNPRKLAELKLIIAREAKVQAEIALLTGQYLKKEDVDRGQVARVHAVRAKLAELPLRASLIAHKGEAECAVLLLDWAREVCNFFAGNQ